MTRLFALLHNRRAAPLLVLAVAFLALIPGIGRPGFWEPQELSVADRAIARHDGKPTTPLSPAAAAAAAKAAAPATPTPASAGPVSGGVPSTTPAATPAPAPTPPPASSTPACPKSAPTPDGARSLTERAVAFGFGAMSSDVGMRLPIALLGLLTVMCIAGIAMRFGGPRAGALAGFIALSFPLLILESRQLTSEIGTAAGAALMVYGFVAIAKPTVGRWRWLDIGSAIVAIIVGTLLAFAGGGALLGLLPPLLAIALGARGAIVGSVRRLMRRTGKDKIAHDVSVGAAALTLLALGGALFVAFKLFTQVYAVREPVAGHLSLFGRTLAPRDCWSTALGGLWRNDDDLRSTFDSSFEQIGFGTFPWGIAAPIAISMLLFNGDHKRRDIGRLTLLWAGLSWLATITFQRKVGFSIYAGFPAMAVALGVWFDDLATPRDVVDKNEPEPTSRRANTLLLGLFIVLGVFNLSKDLLNFTDRFTSLLVGSEAIKYPKMALVLGIPARAWLLVVGVAIAGSIGVWIWLSSRYGDTDADMTPKRHRLADYALRATILLTIVTSWFWAHGWYLGLSRSLSSKQVFASYEELRHDGDQLGIMGDLGNAPRYYADGDWTKLTGRDNALAFLRKPERTFVFAPSSELCSIHKAAAGQPYYVLDDTNAHLAAVQSRRRQHGQKSAGQGGVAQGTVGHRIASDRRYRIRESDPTRRLDHAQAHRAPRSIHGDHGL